MRLSQFRSFHVLLIFLALQLLVGFTTGAGNASGSPVATSGYVDVPSGRLFYGEFSQPIAAGL